MCLPSLLEVLCPASVAEGEAVRVTLRFRNTLQCSLSRVLLLVQAQSLLAQRELTHRSVSHRRLCAYIDLMYICIVQFDVYIIYDPCQSLVYEAKFA